MSFTLLTCRRRRVEYTVNGSHFEFKSAREPKRGSQLRSRRTPMEEGRFQVHYENLKKPYWCRLSCGGIYHRRNPGFALKIMVSVAHEMFARDKMAGEGEDLGPLHMSHFRG